MPLDLKQSSRPGVLFKGLLVIGLFLAAGTGAMLYFCSGAGSGESVDVMFPRGTSQAAVAQILAKEGVIHYPKLFKLMLRLSGGSSRVRAGEFRFQKSMGLVDALFVVYHGAPVLHTVTIPEGWNARQIAAGLAKANLGKEAEFTRLMFSPDSVRKHKLDSPSLEGYLYPSTYSFSRIDGEERIVDTMVKEFFKNFGPELQEEAKELGFTVNQLVTLASIIEKETGIGGERALVASVFHNRLRKKMRLQSDPTIIYGIEGFDGDIKFKDIRRDHPYNTYVIPALPPGPIASPGSAALMAALRPAESNYYYFVANNRGEHIFSESYAEHTNHVNNFQRGGRPPKNEPQAAAGAKTVREPKSAVRAPAGRQRSKKRR